MKNYTLILRFDFFSAKNPFEAAQQANNIVNKNNDAKWTWIAEDTETNEKYKVDLENYNPNDVISMFKKTENMKNFDFNNMNNTELQKEINEISNIRNAIHNKYVLASSQYNHLLKKRRVNPIKFAEAKRLVNFFESVKDKIENYHGILMDEQNLRIDNE